MNKAKEITIALIFIIALALLYVGIEFLKGKNLFSHHNIYYACYNDVTGLSNTTPIFTNGVRVGIIDGINYDYNHPDNIVVRLKVNKKLPIPTGSIAVIETELLGSVNVNLLLAKDSQHILAYGDTLSGRIDKGTMSNISEMIPTIAALVPTLDSLLVSIQSITSDSSLIRSLHNAETLTANANKAVNRINTLTTPAENLIAKLNSVVDNLNAVSSQLSQATDGIDAKELASRLNTTIENLENVSSQLSNGEGTAGKLLSDSTLFENLNKVCTDAQTLVNDIREHPLRYIKFWKKSE